MQKHRIADPYKSRRQCKCNKRPDLYWPSYPSLLHSRVSMMRRSNPCKMNLAYDWYSMQKGYKNNK